MKKLNLIPGLLLLALACAGCQGHKEYDIDQVNLQMTLFEDGLVVPVGSAGPFTAELALKPIDSFLTTLGLPEGVLKIDDKGLLQLDMTSHLEEFNLYQVALETGDKDEPYAWEPGYVAGSPLMGMLMPMIGFYLMDQTYQVTASSRLRNEVPVNGHITVSSDELFTKEFNIENVAIPRYGDPKELAQFSLPDICKSSSARVTFSDLKVTLPAHFGDRISGDGMFRFSVVHKAHMAIDPKFALNLDIPLNVNIPLAQFSLSEVTVGVELESTVPMQIVIERLQAKDEKGEVLENLEITSDIQIAAGSPASPVSSAISLHIKSLDESPIPDINNLLVSFVGKGTENFSDVLLASNQGVSVKHASITISGGVTLFSHE